MDAATLARAMGCSQAVADRYVADMNAAMLMARCTTVRRAAMWCAQVGHESAGLRYMEEIADGSAYEGRRDLGNTKAGDGRRFKGRGPIQLTGRLGYTQFLQWCRDQRLDPPDFLADPAQVATSRWGFLAAAHYWTVRRPKLNEASDAADVLLASQMVNGYVAKPNGLADRQKRWDACLKLDDALLPTGSAVSAPAPKGLPEMIERRLVKGQNVGRIACPTGSVSGLVAAAWVSATAQGGVKGRVLFQKSANADGPPPGSGPAWDLSGKNAARVWEDIPSGTEYLEYWIDAGGEGSLLIEQKGK